MCTKLTMEQKHSCVLLRVATNALFMAFPQHACVGVFSFMSRFIMPPGCILDITEVMSLVLDYWIGEFDSPNSKGVSKGCAWGLFGGNIV